MTRGLLTIVTFWLYGIYWLTAQIIPPVQDGTIYLPWVAHQPDEQPGFPIQAAFYYPWFPEAWRLQDGAPYTQFTPTLGYYDSSESTLIQQHIAAMQYGNIAAGIISWWSLEHQSDQRIRTILAATRGSPFRWTLYYENEARGDPTIEKLTADLQYISDQYGHDPSYLRIDRRQGRPQAEDVR